MSRVDASTSLSHSYSSFSGVDIKAIINGKECGSIQHLSYMIQREKAPNYVMGSVDPVSFGRGKRGINGVIRGLLLDTDLLFSESFKNEKALLDRDELFYLERIERFEQVQKEYIAPRLAKDPDPLPSRYVWIWQNFIKPRIFPGQRFSEGIENCLEGAFEGALQGAAVAAVGSIGGPLALIGVAEALILAIEGCIQAVIESFIYEGGAYQLAVDLVLCLPGTLYYDAYNEAVEMRETLVEANRFNNAKAKPTVTEVRSMVEEKIGEDSNYTLDHEYSLDNLGSNYVVNKAEYLDQILPFDIAIIAVNEYGQSAQMRLYGCEIMSANSEFSIDSMTVPYSLNFTARAILPWRSFDLGNERDTGATQSNEAKQIPVSSSNRPSQGSPFGNGVQVVNQGGLREDEEIDAADDLIDDAPLDSDGDGVSDDKDTDRDNDGILNEDDPNPDAMDDPADFEDDTTGGHDGIEEPEGIQIDELTEDDVEQIVQDTDKDGVPNVADPDNDNDGVLDVDDPAPNFGDDLTGGDDNPEFYGAVDTDGDGIPDFDDDDDDNDGVTDPGDAFPLDPNESVDNDGDGSGANSDPDDNDPNVIGG